MKHASRYGRLSKLLVTAGIGFVAFAFAPTTYAVGTAVNVTIHDTLPGALTISTPVDGASTSSSSLTIEGSLHNISQIMIYVDDVYQSTLPVDAGAATYTVAVVLTPGSHVVKLVAVDPYTGTQIEKTITVTYAPSYDSTPSSPPPSSGGIIIEQGKAAVTKAGKSAQEQIDQASTSGPLKTLSDIGYGALVKLNIISTTAHAKGGIMWLRFVFITGGLMLCIVPWTVYQLAFRLRMAPPITGQRAQVTLPIRLLGLVFFLIPFIFMP